MVILCTTGICIDALAAVTASRSLRVLLTERGVPDGEILQQTMHLAEVPKILDGFLVTGPTGLPARFSRRQGINTGGWAPRRRCLPDRAGGDKLPAL